MAPSKTTTTDIFPSDWYYVSSEKTDAADSSESDSSDEEVRDAKLEKARKQQAAFLPPPVSPPSHRNDGQLTSRSPRLIREDAFPSSWGLRIADSDIWEPGTTHDVVTGAQQQHDSEPGWARPFRSYGSEQGRDTSGSKEDEANALYHTLNKLGTTYQLNALNDFADDATMLRRNATSSPAFRSPLHTTINRPRLHERPAFIPDSLQLRATDRLIPARVGNNGPVQPSTAGAGRRTSSHRSTASSAYSDTYRNTPYRKNTSGSMDY